MATCSENFERRPEPGRTPEEMETHLDQPRGRGNLVTITTKTVFLNTGGSTYRYHFAKQASLFATAPVGCIKILNNANAMQSWVQWTQERFSSGGCFDYY